MIHISFKKNDLKTVKVMFCDIIGYSIGFIELSRELLMPGVIFVLNR